MQPQLLSLGDLSGEHNQDLDKTRERLLRAGSWKHQRVVVIIPAGPSIPTKVYLSHLGIAFPPNNAVHRIAAIGMEVGAAYSNAIEQVVAHPQLSEWEYILTIEHDNMPPGDGVLRLCQRMEEFPEFAGIGGLYFTKGYGGVAQIWGDPKRPLNYQPQPPDPQGGLVECHGTGMGFNLWRMGLFKDARLRRPWFKTQADSGGVSTQDLYFSTDARKYGYRFAVDCSVKVGHYDLDGKVGGIPDKVW